MAVPRGHWAARASVPGTSSASRARAASRDHRSPGPWQNRRGNGGSCRQCGGSPDASRQRTPATQPCRPAITERPHEFFDHTACDHPRLLVDARSFLQPLRCRHSLCRQPVCLCRLPFIGSRLPSGVTVCAGTARQLSRGTPLAVRFFQTVTASFEPLSSPERYFPLQSVIRGSVGFVQLCFIRHGPVTTEEILNHAIATPDTPLSINPI